MEEQDEIIVFKHFETAIDANLAKTKLDAHGIPCFLTEENMSNLYASQSFMVFGVRLHLFSKDAETAKQILDERAADAEPTTCPRCKSEKIEIEYSRKFSSRFTTILMSLAFAIFPMPKVNRCQTCGFEF
jgi:hypothetical protein